jgi:hypothetical protein
VRPDPGDRIPARPVAMPAAFKAITEHDAFVAVLVVAEGASQTLQNRQVVLLVTYAKPRATARPPRVTET